jgi:Leucine-rich repeat (LRR) protein
VQTIFHGFVFSLTYLSLSDNLLYQAEELTLDNLRPSLTTLLISNNGFSRFPNTFQQRFDVLRKLDLSNNRLVIIPTSFQTNTPQLEDLLLDNNQIENIILEARVAQIFLRMQITFHFSQSVPT